MSRASLLTVLIVTGCLAAVLATTVATAAPRAREVSRSSGVFERELSRGATVLDYNRDGWKDLLVGRHYQAFFHLYRNDRDGSFTDVQRQAFPERRDRRDRHGCAAADVDRDGRQDIFCTIGGKKGGNGPTPKELWMQQPGGTFENRARQMRVTDRYGRGRLAVFLNANGDRFPDLLIGNTYPREDGRSGANHLYINQRGERFRRAKGFGLDRVVGASSMQVVRLNRDQRDDVMICGPKGVRLYQNVANRRYRDVTGRLEADLDCRSAALARINGGTRLDLVRVHSNGLAIHLRGKGGFNRPVYRRQTKVADDVAVGDVNRDGRADVYLLQLGRYNEDRPDVMLLNRNGGRRMSQIPIPQTRGGVGESVTSLDYDRNGRADFLIQNGRKKAKGPTRLIAFR